MKIIKSIATFSFICVLYALIAWVSGYNFDQRNFAVGVHSTLAILFGVFVAGAFLDFW